MKSIQVKPRSSSWFSAACAAAVVHRNHFFCLYQKDISDSKLNFRQASNCCKSILEAAKLACANKTENFGELLTVFSTKVDLLYLLYSTVLGLLELWHLTYPRLLIQFGMLVFFTNLSLMEFQVRYLTVFLLF